MWEVVQQFLIQTALYLGVPGGGFVRSCAAISDTDTSISRCTWRWVCEELFSNLWYRHLYIQVYLEVDLWEVVQQSLIQTALYLDVPGGGFVRSCAAISDTDSSMSARVIGFRSTLFLPPRARISYLKHNKYL